MTDDLFRLYIEENLYDKMCDEVNTPDEINFAHYQSLATEAIQNAVDYWLNEYNNGVTQ